MEIVNETFKKKLIKITVITLSGFQRVQEKVNVFLNYEGDTKF